MNARRQVSPRPLRRKSISRCMFDRRWMFFRLERYCERCYQDALALAREMDQEQGAAE